MIARMADYKGKVITTDDVSGDMIFQPILEDGVFRFDCSVDDRGAACPSLSFVNNKDRDMPIMTHKAPLYTPTYKSHMDQQIVQLEVSYYIIF